MTSVFKPAEWQTWCMRCDTELPVGAPVWFHGGGLTRCEVCGPARTPEAPFWHNLPARWGVACQAPGCLVYTPCGGTFWWSSQTECEGCRPAPAWAANAPWYAEAKRAAPAPAPAPAATPAGNSVVVTLTCPWCATVHSGGPEACPQVGPPPAQPAVPSAGPDLWAWDTETELIRPGCLVPRMVCLSTASPGTEPILFHVHGRALSELEAALQDPDKHLIGHNLAYDVAVAVEAAEERDPAGKGPVACAEGGGVRMLRLFVQAADAGRLHCTQIREYLLAIYHGTRKGQPKGWFSLAALAKRHLGADLAKGEDTWRLRYGELRESPPRLWPQDAKAYALKDAATTLAVYQAQEKAVDDLGAAGSGLFNDEARQVRAAIALHLMSAWGIRTDGAAVEKLALDLDALVKRLEPVLADAGIVRPNGTRDMKALRAAVTDAYQAAGLEVPTTEKGAVATDKETLAKVSAWNPALDAVVEHGHASKILDTFVIAAWAGAQRPIQARFNPLVDSGRTSCSGPNLQNLPRKDGVRQCFVPRPGHVFSSCDYSVLELRTLAQVCMDWGLGSRLREAFLAGRDPHAEFGARLARVPYEAFQLLPPAEAKAWRQRAKVLNFGKPGGLGAARLVEYAAAYGVTMTLEEAKQLTAVWLQTWPEMARYFERIASMEVGGFVRVTQVRSGRIRGGCRYTAACNTMFQGLAADGAKDALWEVTKAAYLAAPGDALHGTRPVAFIHDEILCEHPEDRAAEAAQEVARIMVQTMERWTPDVPQVVEPALMRRWEKDAAPAFDEDGNLVPWHAAEGT